MNLIFSGEEPWSKHNGKESDLIKLLCFSKKDIPYLQVPSFPFSNKVRNVDFRLMLRGCLEQNQLKRTNFETIEEKIKEYLTLHLIQDENFDYFSKEKQSKGIKFFLFRSHDPQKNL